MGKSKVKTMLNVFFDIRRLMHHESVPHGKTGNAKFHVEVLKRLKRRIHRLSADITFEQTNALSYQTAKLDRDATPPVVHNKIVLFEIEEGAAAQCSIFLNGLLFKKSGFQTQSQAQDLLMSADTLTPCVGIGKIGEFQPLNSESMTKLSQNHAFSLSCDGSSSPSLQDGSSGRCTACKKCRDLLKARLLRLKKKIKRPLARTAVQRLKWAVRTLKKKKMKLLTLQDALKKMREKTSQISASVFEEKLNLLPKKQQAAVRACFDAAKRKSLRGYHYSKEWLLECIILRMKSARLYEHLRAHKILVLPSHACLQKYIKGFTAAYGFNTKLLSCLKAKVKDMDEMKRHGGIVVDEMKLSAHLDMQSSTHIEGFVDLGKFTDASERHEKADHGLVIMFQPFVGKWTQIIGVFSSSGNVKARLLTKILIEATILCEQAGLYLDYICCDGAPWNRSMWNILGVRATLSDIQCRVVHPCDKHRFLYLISDFPHLMKCT
ncbi:uncharacterized protein LOC125944316 [Dermacentor silvarum]|uniref:uncharacterized protein LOC125944316 n=1 Tax=Dermacentor silvarum TaxID=543639 RepID=UPI0021010F2F|nr:uncharacterized protein LOC125944316 [Dermacentor silvarum]